MNKANYTSSLIGATKSGLSLYQLALAYSIFFASENLNVYKTECLAILNEIFRDKLRFKIEDTFLKTGTTNNNKERYAVLGDPELTFAVLRNENSIDDYSKEGSFIEYLSRQFYRFFNKNNNYKWI